MATDPLANARPAWQTDDLEEEWVEDEMSLGTQSISLTSPLPGFLQTPSADTDDDPSSPVAGGTFMIRDDMPAAALPKTPGRHIKKGGIKDFFSPLALEKMFEPPSPPPKPPAFALSGAPANPSRLSQVFIPDDSHSEHPTSPEDEAVQDSGPKPTSNFLVPPSSTLGTSNSNSEYRFTFSAPRQTPILPQAQSTPGQPKSAPNPPLTDPRLRLFQLQYDTFTRDHLSAMVDSIAVNTPSGANSDGNGSPSSIVRRALFKGQRTPTSSTDMPVRSVKRVKLSPRSECYGEGAGEGATVARPRRPRVDYVGESQSLMQQIKQARDFSTISTTTAQSPASQPPKNAQATKTLLPPSSDSDATVGNTLAPPPVIHSRSRSTPSMTTSSSHSSLAIRQQAEAFMQQIKDEMKGSKRLFSGDTDVSRYTLSDDARTEQTHHSLWSAATYDKEERAQRRSQRLGSSRGSPSLRRQHSPRKFNQSVFEEQEPSYMHEISNMSIEVPWQTVTPTSTVAVPTDLEGVPQIRVTASTIVSTVDQLDLPPVQISHPPSSVRMEGNDDLNRFVSSSTASGTTITTSSAPSFVKHAGPVHIMHIAPSDIPPLPQRIGRMVYDKDLMKWRKASSGLISETDEKRDQTVGTDDAESEDPFRDIDSLREDDSGGSRRSVRGALEGHVAGETREGVHDEQVIEVSRMEEDEDNEQEVDLASFTFDGPSVAAMRIVPSEDDETSDSDSDPDSGVHAVPDTENQPGQPLFDSEDELSHELPGPSRGPFQSGRFDPTLEATPVASASRPSALSTPVPSRSALKSTSVTPVSAMKDPNRDRFRTPAQRLGHRRSVSFSDGKRDGPIRGLSTKPHESDDDIATSNTTGTTSFGTSFGLGQSSSSYSPSARSKRLAEMMHQLEITDDPSESPTRSSLSNRSSGHRLQTLGTRRPSSQVAVADSSGASRRLFSMRSHATAYDGRSNVTFLTECSFGLAHDKLVQVITDVQPFKPHWEELNSIDLSRKSLESVARLKELVPRLNSLTLDHNRLSWLSGIPETLRTLSAASNLLTAVTSFGHLLNLENLDISHNEIDSLMQLGCLRHLRELRADGNKITSLDGLHKLDGLTKLSIQGNLIREVDLNLCRWPRLEMLNLSQNQLIRLNGLGSSLPGLIALNVDGNALDELEVGGVMPRLRVLRASHNRLEMLNVAGFGNLRTLYVDNNSLGGLVKAERLGKLENLSMRNQSCREFHLPTRQFRDVKRLYLSGNKLKGDFMEEPCYNLIYLEVAACRLTRLPKELGRMVPNLRVLNLNYNFLEDVAGLEGLTRMKKLTMIGSRLRGTKALIRVIQRMPEVEMLDVRMNPCTLGWYLPLLVRDVPGALQPSETGDEQRGGEGGGVSGWQELDAKFRRDLPDDVYVGRLAYRGLMMKACGRLRMLDGVEVTEKERIKANHLLQGILSKQQKTITKGRGKSGSTGNNAAASDDS